MRFKMDRKEVTTKIIKELKKLQKADIRKVIKSCDLDRYNEICRNVNRGIMREMILNAYFIGEKDGIKIPEEYSTELIVLILCQDDKDLGDDEIFLKWKEFQKTLDKNGKSNIFEKNIATFMKNADIHSFNMEVYMVQNK